MSVELMYQTKDVENISACGASPGRALGTEHVARSAQPQKCVYTQLAFPQAFAMGM